MAAKAANAEGGGMRRGVLVAAVLVLVTAGVAVGGVPETPTMHNTTGNFWVNHTWSSIMGGWYLISGYDDGVFTGFKRVGSTWQSDSEIVGGLGSIGWYITPTTFQKEGVQYLISGKNGGSFNGYNWTGLTWQADSGIMSGLGDVGEYSAPTVFQMGGTWYLISGEWEGVFNGYNWTGSTWQADSGIKSGLGDVGKYSAPTVFQMGGTWYLIAGENDGVFNGYNWTGSTWQADSGIKSGLAGVGEYSKPTAFQKDGVWYLIAGKGYGYFDGYNWTGSTWQSNGGIVSGLGYVGDETTPTVFDISVNTTDSYNVSVNNVWHNGTTNAYWNVTYSAHAWQNITVYAYNASGSGNLSIGIVSQNTQIPNNPITITNTSDWSGDAGENVYVDYNVTTDIDGDTPTFSCNRTDLFTDFNTATGTGNWITPSQSRTYHVDFGVSDGWGSVSNYTMTIMVSDLEAWWDGDWGNRERIEVNNTCGANLDRFFVGIVLNTTQCAWMDCRDMRIRDPSLEDGEYSWYTASFNNGAPVYQANEVIYVRTPNLDVNETKWIYFYYNNSKNVASTCSGMGGMGYYEDFDDVVMPPPDPNDFGIAGFERTGDLSQTTLLPDGYGGYCIASRNNIDFPDSGGWANSWQNSYKILVQPTATWAGYDYWVKTAAAYNVIIVMEGQESPCMSHHNLPAGLVGVWRADAYTFDMGAPCKGAALTAKFFVWSDTTSWTYYDNIYFNQTYPCDPSCLYYTRETKPSKYAILYDSSGNLVQHAQATIQNTDTGEITERWKDVADGIIDMGVSEDTFQIAVRTFDGVFVHTCNLNTTPICKITIPIHYNLKVYPVDAYDVPLTGVFAGLAEYTAIDPQAFWGMDLGSRGYVPVDGCSGFAMCDLVAEKAGYRSYNVTALNWTSKSALIKDYRHAAVLEEET